MSKVETLITTLKEATQPIGHEKLARLCGVDDAGLSKLISRTKFTNGVKINKHVSYSVDIDSIQNSKHKVDIKDNLLKIMSCPEDEFTFVELTGYLDVNSNALYQRLKTMVDDGLLVRREIKGVNHWRINETLQSNDNQG